MSTDLATLDAVPEVRVIRPLLQPAQLLDFHKQVSGIVGSLTLNVDYGQIPGTQKNSLYKAGAERLAFAFGLIPSFSLLHSEADHDYAVTYQKRKKVWYQDGPQRRFRWEVEEGQSLGLYRYIVACTMTYRGSGEVVGSGIGACSSMEGKYVDRPRESDNTILKMAKKRAFVDAVLTVLALSDRFTQDVEDMPEADTDEPTPVRAEKRAPIPPTDAQRLLFERLTRSHVWSEAEREKMIAAGEKATSERMSDLIDRAMHEIKEREAKEKPADEGAAATEEKPATPEGETTSDRGDAYEE